MPHRIKTKYNCMQNVEMYTVGKPTRLHICTSKRHDNNNNISDCQLWKFQSIFSVR